MISPTIGRVLWYYEQGSTAAEQPLPAVVTAVWGDRCVNLAVFARNGVPMSHPPTSVALAQEEDQVPLQADGTHARHCRWMPYQIQSAAAAARRAADARGRGGVAAAFASA